MFIRYALGPRTALLLLVILIASSNGWSSNQVQSNQGKSSRLALIRGYAPGEFQQSLLDRLSGGLAQQFPYRIAADSRGRILVTDPALSVVHVFDTRQGKRWQIRGDLHHRLRMPAYVSVDADDNIYVTDLKRSAVLVFQDNARFMRTIGIGLFALPTGICVDKQNRKLYVADGWKDQILLFNLEGKLLQTFGTSGTGLGQLRRPQDIVLHRGILVVRDAGNSRFQLFDLQGNPRGIWPYGANRTPIAFAFDRFGNLYYSDLDSGGLVAMDQQGNVLARFDVQRSFGQWIPRPSEPNFRCVATNEAGDILALRPSLNLEVVRLVDAATPQP